MQQLIYTDSFISLIITFAIYLETRGFDYSYVLRFARYHFEYLLVFWYITTKYNYQQQYRRWGEIRKKESTMLFWSFDRQTITFYIFCNITIKLLNETELNLDEY
jgi:hypothetical protein